jgi:DNA-binding MarR family transcriptional regulator
MSEQMAFFPLATYANGEMAGSQPTPTSREAARSISEEIGKRQLEVLRALAVLRQATPDEIATRIGRHVYTTRPRVTELQKRGFVTVTGETRLTPARRFAHVVRLTADGAKYLRENIPNASK